MTMDASSMGLLLGLVQKQAPAAAPAPAPKKRDDLEMVTRADALQIKMIRESSREVDFVASTDTIDSHWEIIDQESWRLDHYKANPVVLYAHDAWDLPIGQCTRVEVRGGQLECTIKFSEATQKAKEVWALVLEKTLRAVSVGFRPVNGSYEMVDGEEVWVWRDCLLKEISVVAIPSNPEALAKMKSAIASRTKESRAGSPASDEPKTAGDTGTKEEAEMKTIEQLTKELEDQKAKSDAASTKLAELNVKLVETEQRAEKAEAAKSVAEKALTDVRGELEKVSSAAKVLETEHTKACTDRDEALAKVKELDGKLITIEVDAIVGKKIAPSEKEEFVELRRSNPALFEKMVAKRPDMKLTERVTQNDEVKDTSPEGTQQKAVDVWNSSAS